ncbi:GPR endopeptidase [Mycoplasmatota bacterium]|nr:GPR endopeptidase [Mycoplasmatota bacterium]
MKDIDLSNYQPRTDLAYEEIEASESNTGIMNEELHMGEVKIYKTSIDERGEQLLGKKKGLYLTVDTTGVITQDHDELVKIQDALVETLGMMFTHLNIGKDDKCLVIGLGNDKVTPDALGPVVIENILVTNHIFEIQPENVEEGYRRVCGVIPGVMGETGIETYEIVDAIAKRVSPDFVVVVDALAAKSIKRVNKTIQITDTGIHPGSGVGNKRKEISKETLGVPVIAIGVPTVVDAVSITSDTIDFILKYLGQEMNPEPKDLLVTSASKSINYDDYTPKEEVKKHFFGHIGLLEEEEKRQLIYEALSPSGFNMMVTPKEVDTNIEDLGMIISKSLDIVLHEPIKENATS